MGEIGEQWAAKDWIWESVFIKNSKSRETKERIRCSENVVICCEFRKERILKVGILLKSDVTEASRKLDLQKKNWIWSLGVH